MVFVGYLKEDILSFGLVPVDFYPSIKTMKKIYIVANTWHKEEEKNDNRKKRKKKVLLVMEILSIC